jgi:hypothetical protein
MSDQDEALALARAAAEAIRSLNHATLGGEGLGQPSDACEVLGELSLTASRIPQFLGQVGRWPAAAVSGAWLFISDARASAAALAEALGQAQQQLSAVNGQPSRPSGKDARS